MRRSGRVLTFALCSLLSAQTTPSRQQQLDAHSARVREFLAKNRPDLAIPELRAIVALEPANADAHANLGALIFFQGDYAKAAAELRDALRLRPGLWKSQALLGLAERRLGQSESARNDLEQAFPKLEEEKLRVQAGLELTEIYYAGNQLDKAASLIAVLRAIRPADPDVLYTAHRIYADLADETMLSVAMAAPGSARMRQLMGNEWSRRGNGAAAIEQYREALKIDAHLPGAHFQLAETLKASPSAEDQAAAEAEYERGLAENPSDVRSLCRLAEYALGRSDFKAASARYTRAVELQPRDEEANLGVARVLMQTGQNAKAEPFLLRAAEADPTDPAVHMRLATVYRESGRAEAAARELSEFRKLKDLKDRLREVYGKMNTPR